VLEVSFRLVKDGELQRPRAWMAELNRRQAEVRETFLNETVRHEVAYLVRGEQGSILVYAIEAEDPDRGHRAAATSKLPIDVQHREVMAPVLEGPAEAELLYECRLRD
jgi:hypothetical protein